MRRLTRWSLMDIARMIVSTLLSKYDFFIVIEGGTGIGKSTLAYHIAKRVALEFWRMFHLHEDTIAFYYERVGKKMNMTEEEFLQKILLLKQNKEYKFSPKKCLIYTQDDLQKHLASWHNIAIPDEMINITFNRDFYSEKQKDIIKMINMFRDHENLTIACVPIFATLDTQIKNLCKMKITVKKRGKAIIHTPNKVIYSKDKWDQATNEKIEKDWIIKKKKYPPYSKLTTFRGIVRFPPLTKKEEAIYQEVKNQKRNVVLKDEMHIDMKETKEDDPFQKVYQRLIGGGVKNFQILEGMALGMGVTVDQLKNKLIRELRKNGKAYALSSYFFENKKIKDMPVEYAGITA